MNSSVEKVEYYLDGDVTIKYVYYPGSSVYALIAQVVDDWASVADDVDRLPKEVFVRSDVFIALKAQMASQPTCNDHEFYNHIGPSQLIISTIYTRVAVRPVHRLRWPVFYGSRQEYENNILNQDFERALNAVRSGES